MMLVDSNILIYSINKDSDRHQSSRKFIQSNLQGVCVAHQNILELLRVVTHPVYPGKLAVLEARKIAAAFVESMVMISPNDTSLEVFALMVEKYAITSNRVFDAYLVATMLSNNVTELATDNVKHFRIFSEIKVVNPFGNEI